VTPKPKYKVEYFEDEYTSWRVYGEDGPRAWMILAEFFGDHAKRYAYEHARRLRAEK